MPKDKDKKNIIKTKMSLTENPKNNQIQESLSHDEVFSKNKKMLSSLENEIMSDKDTPPNLDILMAQLDQTGSENIFTQQVEENHDQETVTSAQETFSRHEETFSRHEETFSRHEVVLAETQKIQKLPLKAQTEVLQNLASEYTELARLKEKAGIKTRDTLQQTYTADTGLEQQAGKTIDLGNLMEQVGAIILREKLQTAFNLHFDKWELAFTNSDPANPDRRGKQMQQVGEAILLATGKTKADINTVDGWGIVERGLRIISLKTNRQPGADLLGSPLAVREFAAANADLLTDATATITADNIKLPEQEPERRLAA